MNTVLTKAERAALQSRIDELIELLAAKDRELIEAKRQYDALFEQYIHVVNKESLLQTKVTELKNDLKLLKPPEKKPLLAAPSDLHEPEPIPDVISAFNLIAAELRIAIVGGSPTWQKKAADTFPLVRIIGNQDFEPGRLDSIDVLLINTNHVSHACTQKASSIANARRIEFYYTSKHNLEQIAEELCARLQPFLT